MAQFTISELIGAPRERVFAVFSDLGQFADRVEGIEQLEVLSDGPTSVGTRFRETRILHGRRATETLEITEFEPPRCYTVECRSHGTCYRSVFEFEPATGGTQVTVNFTAHPRTFVARLLAPLGRLMLSSVRRTMERDIEDLRRAAVDRTGEGPGSLR